MAICKALTYFAIVYLALMLVSVWLTRKSYEFNVKKVKDIAYSCSGTFYSHSRLLNYLTDFYEGSILNGNNFPPLSVSTGGLHGAISLLYGSMSEFLAIYHAPIHTTGSSGEHYVHRIGEKSFVEMSKGTNLMLYGRGFIPLTMGYWISDSLFSCLDIATAVLTVTYYIRAVYTSSAISAAIMHYFNVVWTIVHEGVSGLPEAGRSLFYWILGYVPHGSGNLMDN